MQAHERNVSISKLHVRKLTKVLESWLNEFISKINPFTLRLYKSTKFTSRNDKLWPIQTYIFPRENKRAFFEVLFKIWCVHNLKFNGDGEKRGGCVSIVVKNGKTRLLEPSLILGIREYHTLVTSKKIQQSSITLADLFISKKIWCTKEYVFLTKNTIKIAFVVLCTIISHIWPYPCNRVLWMLSFYGIINKYIFFPFPQ